MRPVEAGTRQQLHRAAIEARMHAVAVIFDFVEPVFAFRRCIDQPGQLRLDPLRQRGSIARGGGFGHAGDRFRR
jgi:hypothetical protein